MSEATIERPRLRAKPSKSAAAEMVPESSNFVETPTPPKASAPEKKPVEFLEVEIKHKYVPHLCYEETPEGSGNYEIVRDENGDVIVQSKVKIGESQDRFGRPVDVFKQILDSVPPGTVINLPHDEAVRALRLGIAKFTDRTI